MNALRVDAVSEVEIPKKKVPVMGLGMTSGIHFSFTCFGQTHHSHSLPSRLIDDPLSRTTKITNKVFTEES